MVDGSVSLVVLDHRLFHHDARHPIFRKSIQYNLIQLLMLSCVSNKKRKLKSVSLKALVNS